jgi:methylthioribose-1-phosphate isomerase
MKNDIISIKPPVKVLEWIGQAGDGYLRLLDQTRLPTATEFLDCPELPSVWDAISRLVVRGAPAIGVAAGYGMVVAAQSAGEGESFLRDLRASGDYLNSSRPTAVNLAWAVGRMMARAQKALAAGLAVQAVREELLDEARGIQAQDERMCASIGQYAVELIRGCTGVLTHCNAGALATAGIGTATAGMYVAHAQGHRFCVYCDETRPLLQGARLTAWELMQAGIETVVICDNMAAQVMREHRVQMVIVGADRIAANGDAANKIGTYGLAIAARRHGIPFYVAAPYSTFDLSLPCGEGIPIEQRDGAEVANGFGRTTAPAGVRIYNPAFDVTPAELITALITDRGIIQPVNEHEIRKKVDLS